MRPINSQWFNPLKANPNTARIVMRPVGGGLFVRTLQYPHPSNSLFALPVRTAVVGGLDTAYDLFAYDHRVGYVTASYNLSAFSRTLTNQLNGSYNLSAFKPSVGGVNAAYSILTFAERSGKLNASYDLFSYKAQVGGVNASYNILNFTGATGGLNAVYNILTFQQKANQLNAQYALNAFIPKTGGLNTRYDISVYKAKTGGINTAYGLYAFSSRKGGINAQYDLNAFVRKTGYVQGSYNLNAYQTVVGYVNGFYDLLANEVFYGWAMNLTTGAVSKYENLSYNSLSGTLGADSDGIHNLYGTTDNGTAISGFVESGSIKLSQTSNLTRAVDAYIGVKGGALKLTMTDELTGSNAYTVPATTKLMTVKRDLGRKCRGKYWKLKLENVAGSTAAVDSIEINTEELSRRI